MTRRDQKKRAEAIAEMWKRGAPAPEIAIAFGVQKPAIYNALRRTGDLPPYGKRPARSVLKLAAAGPIIARDPCPRCGTRADYGCAHSARVQHSSTIGLSSLATMCSEGVSP